MLWFGWYIEPQLGVGRSAILYSASAATGGLAYVLLSPVPALPLAGGVFLVSATGAAFLIWTILSTSIHGLRFSGVWLLALCWLVLVLAGARPLYLLAIHVLSWGVGILLYFWLHRSPMAYHAKPT
jgi:hypothetical protein